MTVTSKPRRLKILTLSRAYPNNVLTSTGLWVKRLVDHTQSWCDQTVISPVPYFPPLPGFSYYKRFRQVVRKSFDSGVEVYHPRMFVGPGLSLYQIESSLYYLRMKGFVHGLQRRFSFDLIHAHFTYPDGVVAALLGKRYGVPVIITEHALWAPSWMDKFHLLRRQAIWASKNSTFHIAVSKSVKESIARYTGTDERIRVVPIGVEENIFQLARNGDSIQSNQILFVGFINYNKGVDVLLKAMQRLMPQHPKLRLTLVGGNVFKDANRKEQELQKMADQMGVGEKVRFLGIKSPIEVAQLMKESALLVLPSRRESFGAVLVEALACGIPVVATRCGGPEDIVNEQVGVLVKPDDEHELARGIEQVLENRSGFNGKQIRAYALDHFSWKRIAQEIVDLYSQAMLARNVEARV